MKSLIFLLTFSFFLLSCSYNEVELPSPANNDSTSGTDTTTTSITYTNHAKQIIDNHCVSCHSTNGQFPALTNYTEVKNQINRIQVRAIDNTPTPMPPTPLSQNLKDTLQLWINQGGLQ